MTLPSASSSGLLERAAQGFRATLISQVIRVICKAAAVVIIARLVSPADHGRYAMAATVFFVVVLFRDAGLGAAAIQAPSLSAAQSSALFKAHLLLGAVLASVTLAVAPLAAAFFDEPQVLGLLAGMSAALLLIGLGGWPRVLLSRELRFVELNRLETIAAIAATGAMIVAAFAGAGAFTFVVFLLISEAIVAVGAWRSCRWRPRERAAWASLTHLLRPGMHVTGHQALAAVVQQLESVFMGRWFGPGALGLYNRPTQLLALPNQHVSVPLTQVLTASLSRIGPKGDGFAAHLGQTANLIAHLTLPISAVCVALPDEIVRLLLGAAWPQAAPLLRWISIGWAATYLSSTIYPLCIATGHTRRLAAIAALNFVATLGGLWFGRDHGPRGLAAGVALANVATLVPRLGWATLGTPVRLRDYAAAFLGPAMLASSLGIGCGAGSRLVSTPEWTATLAGGAAGGAIAVALVLVASSRIRGELARAWRKPAAPAPALTADSGSIAHLP